MPMDTLLVSKLKSTSWAGWYVVDDNRISRTRSTMRVQSTSRMVMMVICYHVLMFSCRRFFLIVLFKSWRDLIRQENPHCLLLTERLHEEFDPLPMPTLSLPGVKIAPSSSVKHIIHTSTQPGISIFKGATSSHWVRSAHITLAPVTTQGSCWKVKVLRDGIISMQKSSYGWQIFAQFYRCTHWTQGLRGTLWAPRG